MNESAHAEMSAIVITPDHYETVRPVVQALRRQTVRKKLEIVLVGPAQGEMGVVESDFSDFAGFQVLEENVAVSTAIARAAGIRAARAPIVVLTEEHSFPAEDWAEALIDRHQESWTGVGPLPCNGNPATTVSWANFLIEYGDWVSVSSCRRLAHIPGHNSSYKRDALLEYGSTLADMLEAETPMQWDMGAKGHSFCIEPGAKSYHVNFSVFSRSIALRFNAGRLFASNRSSSWATGKRVFYSLASPLIPFVRAFRLLRTVLRIDTPWFFCRTFPCIFILLAADGLGEMVGYAAGAGKAMEKVSAWEFHRERYLVQRERALKDDVQQIYSQGR